MLPHPFEPHKIGHLTPLSKNVSAGALKVSRVKTRLKFGGDKFPLRRQSMTIFDVADWIVKIVKGIRHFWFWCRRPFCSASEVVLENAGV